MQKNLAKKGGGGGWSGSSSSSLIDVLALAEQSVEIKQNLDFSLIDVLALAEQSVGRRRNLDFKSVDTVFFLLLWLGAAAPARWRVFGLQKPVFRGERLLAPCVSSRVGVSGVTIAAKQTPTVYARP